MDNKDRPLFNFTYKIERRTDYLGGNNAPITKAFLLLRINYRNKNLSFKWTLDTGALKRGSIQFCKKANAHPPELGYLNEEKVLFIPIKITQHIYQVLMKEVNPNYLLKNSKYPIQLQLHQQDLNDLQALEINLETQEEFYFLTAKSYFDNKIIAKENYLIASVIDGLIQLITQQLKALAILNLNAETISEQRKKLLQFLDDNTGNQALLKKFSILRFKTDNKSINKIKIDLMLMPNVEKKAFWIQLEASINKQTQQITWDKKYQEMNPTTQQEHVYIYH